MKRFINGEEVDLGPSSATVARGPDRLFVHTDDGAFSAAAVRQGDTVLVSFKGIQYKVERAKPRGRAGATAGSGEMRAPMPGQIVDVLATEGKSVKKGERILVLEAMKTQQPFVAPFDGTVSKIAVVKGQQVGDGELLALVIKADENRE